MNPAPPALPDPIRLLGSLTADQLRRRLAELEAERQAVIALLRGVAARERALARRQGVSRG